MRNACWLASVNATMSRVRESSGVFVDLTPGMTEGMNMVKRLCAAIGLVAIAILMSPRLLYGA